MDARGSWTVTFLVALVAVSAWSQGDCIQNPDFSGSDGWQLRQGGASGTARILGGFLELSVSFPSDFAEARQRCSSTASRRTVQVDVSDQGLGTTRFEIGWENEDRSDGEYQLVTTAGVAMATTSNPSFDHIVFRADGLRIGAAAQALDNVQIVEFNPPAPGEVANHLLGASSLPAGEADLNGDGEENVADVVTAVNL